jgi:DNA polymerase-2
LDIQQGFVLTRQARDFSGRTQIDLWLSTPKGPTLLTIQNEKPVFFVAQSDIETCQSIANKEAIDCQFKPLELATFDQTPLAACYTSLSRSSFGLAQAFNDEDVQTFESDIRLADRFLMERFIKGSIEFTGAITQKKTTPQGFKHKMPSWRLLAKLVCGFA